MKMNLHSSSTGCWVWAPMQIFTLTRSENYIWSWVVSYIYIKLKTFFWISKTFSQSVKAFYCYFNPYLRIHLRILERGEGREREKYLLVASCMHSGQGSHPQPMRVSWQGIKPSTFSVHDSTPTNWATWPGLKSFLKMRFLNNFFKKEKCAFILHKFFMVDIRQSYFDQAYFFLWQ